MNVMAIINIVIWSYVGLVGLVLFGRWVFIKIRTHIAVKKSMNKKIDDKVVEVNEEE